MSTRTSSFDKPFKTYDELLNLLESRNVVIPDRSSARIKLSTISYYSLVNGYKDLYERDESDKFIEPIEFDDLYILYNFETSLNNIIFKYIIYVEKALKSSISYIVSEKYGVFTDYNDLKNTNTKDYLYRKNYRSKLEAQQILRDIKLKIQKSSNESVCHYKNNHNHIPCWIVVNDIPFGAAIKWFEILKGYDKTFVAEVLFKNIHFSSDEKKEFLNKGLTILRKYRNNIAHGNKIFINYITEELPKRQVLKIAKGEITDTDYKNGIGKNDIFAVIITLYATLYRDHRILFLNEIINLFSSYAEYRFMNGKDVLEMLSLPNDFVSKLINLNSFQ